MFVDGGWHAGVTHCNTNRPDPWRVQISYNGKRKALGYYASEEEAARAYDAAARLYHGENAMLNFQHGDSGGGQGEEEGMTSGEMMEAGQEMVVEEKEEPSSSSSNMVVEEQGQQMEEGKSMELSGDQERHVVDEGKEHDYEQGQEATMVDNEQPPSHPAKDHEESPEGQGMIQTIQGQAREEEPMTSQTPSSPSSSEHSDPPTMTEVDEASPPSATTTTTTDNHVHSEAATPEASNATQDVPSTSDSSDDTTGTDHDRGVGDERKAEGK